MSKTNSNKPIYVHCQAKFRYFIFRELLKPIKIKVRSTYLLVDNSAMPPELLMLKYI